MMLLTNLCLNPKRKACVRRLFLLLRGCGGFCRLSRGYPVPFITPSENTAFTVTTHTNNASGSKETPWELTDTGLKTYLRLGTHTVMLSLEKMCFY